MELNECQVQLYFYSINSLITKIKKNMKAKFYAPAIALVIFAAAIKANAQANKTLSNLTNPTSVNVDLVPNSSGTRNLGSSTKSWNNVFANGAYYLDGTPFI